MRAQASQGARNLKRMHSELMFKCLGSTREARDRVCLLDESGPRGIEDRWFLYGALMMEEDNALTLPERIDRVRFEAGYELATPLRAWSRKLEDYRFLLRESHW